MKTLLLLRHAKSSWDDRSLRDFDRPLNERGLKAAPLIGELIGRRKLRPQLVISSPAERARQTASLVLRSAGLAEEVRYDSRVYEASMAQLLDIVREIDEKVESAMLVGHNYGIENLLEHLTGEARHMPTAALAQIALDVDGWNASGASAGRLEFFVKPKDLSG